MLRRVPFLARLGGRYAMRRKGQTLRAALGLLATTAILVAALGMGESLEGYAQETIESRYGPIEVVARSPVPFDAAVGNTLLAHARGQGHDVQGVSTLLFTGPVVFPQRGVAEAFVDIRGVVPGELAALGPILGPGGQALPEPGPGEAVVDRSLADALGVSAGDRIVVRAPVMAQEPRFNLTEFTGATSPVASTGVPAVDDAIEEQAPVQVPPHAVALERDAMFLAVSLSTTDMGPMVEVTVRSPSGESWSNASSDGFVGVIVEGPLDEGAWEVDVGSDVPVAYELQVGLLYAPKRLVEMVSLDARVVGVAEDGGRAGFTGRQSVLVPLRELQEEAGLGGQVNRVIARTSGDPGAVAASMREAVPEHLDGTLVVAAQKQDALAFASEMGRQTTGFMFGMGSFTIVAGVLLAYTLFTALVEERRREVGVTRAIGFPRGELTFSMVAEGSTYAALAALAGLAVGVGFLVLLTGVMDSWDWVSGMRARVSTTSILVALVVGMLLPLAAIAWAAGRFAGLDPARAIRDEPEPEKRRRLSGALVGGAIFAVGILLSLAPPAHVVGNPLAVLGLAVVLAALGRVLWAWLLAGAAGVYLVVSLYTFDDFPDEVGELDPILTMARGLLLVFIVVLLFLTTVRFWPRVPKLFGSRRPRPSSFVTTRYLVAEKRVAGLTAIMIAVVVVMVTMGSTMMASFAVTAPQDEGGFSVYGDAGYYRDDWPVPLSSELERDVQAAHFLPRHDVFTQANITVVGDEATRAEQWSFMGVTPGFARGTSYELVRRADVYGDDAAAWQAVADGEAILLGTWTLSEIGGPGTRVVLQHPVMGSREYTVAGSVDSWLAGSTFLAHGHVVDMGFPLRTAAFVAPAPGVDPDDLAQRLTAEMSQEGFVFQGVETTVAQMLEQFESFMVVLQAFVALGVAVGLSATGLLASRAVVTRRREIGTMRALGFEPAQVRRTFVWESLATAAGGLLAGTTIGILIAHSVWWRIGQDEPTSFTLPVFSILAFTVGILALAGLAAWGPARRAARLDPAKAVRHVE